MYSECMLFFVLLVDSVGFLEESEIKGCSLACMHFLRSLSREREYYIKLS